MEKANLTTILCNNTSTLMCLIDEAQARKFIFAHILRNNKRCNKCDVPFTGEQLQNYINDKRVRCIHCKKWQSLKSDVCSRLHITITQYASAHILLSAMVPRLMIATLTGASHRTIKKIQEAINAE